MSQSVFTYLQSEVARLSASGNTSASEKVRATMERFRLFSPDNDCPLEQLTTEDLNGFQEHMKAAGLKQSTISFYLCTLRRTYNTAVRQGITSDHKPFAALRIKKAKNTVKSISLADVMAIKNIDLSNKKHLDFARNMFMFSLYAKGMFLVDMAYLRKEDVKDGTITYTSRITKQLITMEWRVELQDIIDKYPENPSQYLLPIITDESRSDRQFANQRKRIYLNLREVARRAGVTGPITMNTARATLRL